jgi:ubiquinone/menaquinone biosynthesis C-methylase UbiE
VRARLELLELQPEMVAKAQRKLHARGQRNVRFTVHDANEPLPYNDECFDVAVLIAVLGEISKPESCLRELLRVLRPGGVLAIHEHLPDPDRIPLVALRSVVERCGFRFRQSWGPSWNYTATFQRPFEPESA